MKNKKKVSGPAQPAAGQTPWLWWAVFGLFVLYYYCAVWTSSVFGGLLSGFFAAESHAAGARPYIFLLPQSLGIALWFFSTAGALGWMALTFVKKELSPEERSVFGVLIGFAFWVYALWFLGLAGGFTRTALFIFCAIMTLVSSTGWRGFFSGIVKIFGVIPAEAGIQAWTPASAGVTSMAGYSKGFRAALIAFAIFFIGGQMIASHAPTIERDDLSYHLYIPASYLEAGKIDPPPFEQRQSFYHQMINMSYIPALALGGEPAAKMFNFIWGLVLAWLIYLFSKRVTQDALTGLIAALAFYSSPLRFHLSLTAITDLAAASYSLGSLLFLFIFDASRKRSHLWFSAFLAAFSLNKYTSWTYFAASLLVLFWICRRDFRMLAEGLLAHCIFSCVCLAPLAAYLWSVKGNPLYPVPILGLPYDSIEMGLQKAWSASRNWETVSGIARGSRLYLGPFAALALGALFFRSRLSEQRLTRHLGLLFFWLVFTVALKYWAQGGWALLPRYLMASYAAAFIPAAWVWGQMSRESAGSRRLMQAFFFWMLIFPGMTAAILLAKPQFQLNAGALSVEEFLSRYYPSEGWDMVKFVNQLPEGSKVAALDHHFIPFRYKESAKNLWAVPAETMMLSDPDAVSRALEAKQITHVLWPRSQWLQQPSMDGFILHAVLFGASIRCHWWEKTPALPFLEPVYESGSGILFRVVSAHAQ